MLRSAILTVVIMLVFGLAGATDQTAGYTELRDKAEALVAKNSFALALEIYQGLEPASLDKAEREWLRFRLADLGWRANRHSRDKREKARQQLEEMFAEREGLELRDRIWVELAESLAELNRSSDRNRANQLTHSAMDWWATSPPSEEARQRYLRLFWNYASSPTSSQRRHVTRQMAEDAVTLAETAEEKTRAHLHLAQTMHQTGGGLELWQRIPAEFEAAIAAESNRFTAGAMGEYADWLSKWGRVDPDSPSGHTGDLVRALALYRRIVDEFDAKDTRWVLTAQRKIDEITRVSSKLAVNESFLPGSKVRANLSWRNVPFIDLTMYRLELTRLDLEPIRSQWYRGLGLDELELIRSWRHETDDKGDHQPGTAEVRLADQVAPGCYLLVASSAAGEQRAVILVTDLLINAHIAPGQALIWAVAAESGEPLQGVPVRIWRVTSTKDEQEHVPLAEAVTNEDGIAEIDAEGQLLILAGKAQRQAFATASSRSLPEPEERTLRVHAAAERPLFRPGERASFSFVARWIESDGYTTPVGAQLKWEVIGPRRTEGWQGDVVLDEFGTASAFVNLPKDASLGLYELSVYSEEAHRVDQKRSDTIFRVEEHRLPEMNVEVLLERPHDESGIPQPNTPVEATITASYYHGGPVQGAAVEAIVTQTAPWRGNESAQHEFLTTDTEGRATLVIPSNPAPHRDQRFTVEAKVRDSSFREVVGRGHLTVPRHPIALSAKPEKSIVDKGEETRIHIESRNANGAPLPWTGTATIVRRRWVQTWTAPDGRVYQGQELRELMLRDRNKWRHTSSWNSGGPNWQEDEIDVVGFETADNGEATVEFRSDDIGEYKITITADPTAFQQSTAIPVSATVWVAEPAGSHLDIGELNPLLIVDRDNLDTGEELTLLIVSPIADSWILLTVEGSALEHHHVLRLSGNSRKVTLPIDRRFAPNIDLAVTNSLGVGFRSARKTLTINPVEHQLTIDLSTPETEYYPGAEAELTVKATDHQGRPVRGRVFLAVTDDALRGIQEDLAPDIGEFFWGDRRRLSVSSYQWPANGLTRLVEIEDFLVPEDQVERKRKELEQRREKEAAERSRGTPTHHSGQSQNAAYAPAPRTISDYTRLSPVSVVEVAAIELRTDFSNTALWQPRLETDDNGEARVRFTLSDSLTTWRAKGWGVSAEDQYGQGLTTFKTNRPLQVRLQAPRFLVEGDQATISAMIDNRSAEDITVRPHLDAENLKVKRGRRSLEIPANTSTRVDWSAKSKRPGPVNLTVSAQSADDGDGMQRSISTVPHGIAQTITVGGAVEDEEEEWILRLPPRKSDSTRAEVQLSPGLAAALVDALPYLVDYPYGCTEQTMSRFLPAAVVAHTLERLGLPAEAVEKRIGFVKSDDSGSEIPGLSALENVTQKSLDRLAWLQHEEGHWGWWTSDAGDLFMTAYVVWGLQIAEEAGVELGPEWSDRLDDAGYALEDMVGESTPLDLAAFVSCVLSGSRLDEWDREDLKEQIVELVDRSQESSLAATAMLATAAHQLGMDEEAQRLARNLANGVILDSGPDSSRVNPEGATAKKPRTTAHWIGDGDNGRWFGGAVETTAWVVRALARIAPDSGLIAPAEAWLVSNRQGAGWSNTRETAVAVLTLASLLDRRQEDEGDLSFEIRVNGSKLAARDWSADQVLLEQTRFPIPERLLVDGENRISVRRISGGRPIEVSTTAHVWSLEEPISAAGHGLFLRRQYFRIVAIPGLLRGASLSKHELNDDEPLSSGDRIEAVITVESKSDLPYVLIEDLKPAGFEVVRQKSGETLVARRLSNKAIERRFEDTGDGEPFQGSTTGRGPKIDETGETVPVHQELRERLVALFITDLPQGVWEVRYQLRAETPGEFHGLPAIGEAMYAPQIKANSAEQRVTIR